MIYKRFYDYTKHKYIFTYTNDQIHYTYKITNKINNNFYIGKHTHNTKEPDFYYGSGNLINKAIEKYGIENFEKVILSYYRTSKCALIGESIILTQDIVDSPGCYNMKIGGEGGSIKGRKMSVESIIKRTLKQKGLKRSTETCKKLSIAKKGHVKSKETRLKISESKTGKNNPNYGNPRSEEVKNKIRDAQLGNKSFWYGHNMDEEVKNKISDSLKNHYKNNDHKTCKSVVIDGIHYKSLSYASICLGISRKVITSRCKSINWSNYKLNIHYKD